MVCCSGLQKPRKPLRFISARNGQFAKICRAANANGLPTNLGVRSSNLFGRVIASNLRLLRPSAFVLLLMAEGLKASVVIAVVCLTHS